MGSQLEHAEKRQASNGNWCNKPALKHSRANIQVTDPQLLRSNGVTEEIVSDISEAWPGVKYGTVGTVAFGPDYERLGRPVRLYAGRPT